MYDLRAQINTMDYYRYDLNCASDQADMLIAFLSEGAFDTFEENETGLSAYLPARAGVEEAERLLSDLQQQFEFTWERQFIPGQNWNEIWESNFQPVIVHDFCAVRADFHPPISGVKWELVINPKMAFGTGHHETTWQCMAALEKIPVQGQILLDFGCGTGILAILASKLGAAEIEAVDIEEESYRNTIENSQVNGVNNVVARCGTLDAVEGTAFDGILANINRHVILDALPRLAQLVKPGAWLLISGILLTDETIVVEAAAEAGFDKQWITKRGNWLCGYFVQNQG
ncbi:MAG: 50S ribosomal protein L11 methyltransferase [Saprospiraceae bacterium]|nr:50S ribosomal protein L11 methyltransferase [Saprospiraceae bacterium]